MADPSKPFGTLTILWEAIKLLAKSKTLILPILLLSFSSSSLLFFINYLSIFPLLVNLFINLYIMGNTRSYTLQYTQLLATIRNDIAELTAIETIFILLSFLISSVVVFAVVLASSITYLGRCSTSEELLFRIKRSWKGPTLTLLFLTLLNLGGILWLSSLILYFVLIPSGSVTLFALGVVLGLLGLYCYLSLATVCSLGVVVSVAEDGCYGPEALRRAVELIQGKKREGAAISFVMMVATCATYGACTFSTVYVPRITDNLLVNGFVAVNVGVLLSVIIIAAYTVLYYECKKSHGEEIPMRCGFVYARLPSTFHVTEAFP